MLPIRVLICDDTLQERTITRELSKFGDKVVPKLLRTIDEAEAAVTENYFDIAFVDYKFENDAKRRTGIDLLKVIGKKAPSCQRVLMTKFLELSTPSIFEFPSLPKKEERLLLVNKTGNGSLFEEHIRRTFESRLAQRWIMPDLTEPVERLIGLKKDAPNFRWNNSDAVLHEVQKILFDLFDAAASTTLASESIRLQLDDIHRGQSGSVALQVCINYGSDQRGDDVLGTRCIVKLGKRASIEDETNRYKTFIRMGVPSEFRVEMLGESLGDGLGGVCYTLAGGSFSKTIEPFDNLLKHDEIVRASSVINKLFDPVVNVRSWDAIIGTDEVISDFYANEFDADLPARIRHMRDVIRTSKVGTFDEVRNRWTLGAQTVDVPDNSIIGDDPWKVPTPTCLLHGDMHGGNILVNEADDPYMIDFADSGIGPRFVDASALANTVRLHSQSIDEQTPEGHFGKIVDAESRLLKEKVTDVDLAKFKNENWFQLANLLNRSALRNAFADGPEAISELAQTQLCCALTFFSLPWHSDLQRLRLAIWICALHTHLVKNPL